VISFHWDNLSDRCHSFDINWSAWLWRYFYRHRVVLAGSTYHGVFCLIWAPFAYWCCGGWFRIRRHVKLSAEFSPD